MKKTIFSVIVLALLFLLMEGLSHAGLYFLKSARSLVYEPISYPLKPDHQKTLRDVLSGKLLYLVHNAQLGWTVNRGSRSQGLYQSNSLGIRSDREYALHPPAEKIRIAAFGDSFTHCDDVSNSETWEHDLEVKDPQLEVLNFGVGGYGIDQAFLRYRLEGKRFSPQIVLIGFMSENIYRSINTFRPFYMSSSGIPLGKPRFKIENNELILLPNPTAGKEDIQALLNGDQAFYKKLKAGDGYEPRRYKKGAYDFLASVRLYKMVKTVFLLQFRENIVLGNGEYDTQGEAYKVTFTILKEFYAEVIKNDSIPVIVLFPTEADLNYYLRTGRTSSSPLIRELKEKGFRFIDLAPVLAAHKNEFKSFFAGHYTGQGNRLVSEAVYGYLEKQEFFSSKKTA